MSKRLRAENRRLLAAYTQLVAGDLLRLDGNAWSAMSERYGVDGMLLLRLLENGLWQPPVVYVVLRSALLAAGCSEPEADAMLIARHLAGDWSESRDLAIQILRRQAYGSAAA